MKYTIDKVKELLREDNVDAKILIDLEQDERKGVVNALKSYNKRLKNQQKLLQRFNSLKSFDSKYLNNSQELLVGVDEVGRGPLAGPVVCCAVIIKPDFNVLEVFDSKKLSKNQRESLINIIYDNIIDVGFAIIDVDDIDTLNIYQAAKKGMHEAINNLNYKPNIVLADAMKLNVKNALCYEIIKADAKSLSVATASILAKHVRDELMINYAQTYPQYDFENNMGYGTKKHLDALKIYGITPIHRKTFEPIKTMINK